MPRPFQSIRWRFALWLAFLLTIVLAGFGITAYQLHSNNQFNQLDEELKNRAAALTAVLRTPPNQFQFNRGGPRGFGPRDGMDFNRNNREPSRRDSFDPGSREGTNSVNHSNRFFDGGPPRRFSFDDEPPARSRDMRDFPDLFAQRIRASAEIAKRFDEAAPEGFYFAVWFRAFNSAKELQSTNAPAAIPFPDRDGTDTSTHARTRANFREVWQYTEMGDAVLVGKSVLTELEATQQFALWLVLGGLAVLALGVVGIWWLAGQALKPVHAISTAATRISAGNLAERINVSTTDNELGELAQTLNSTFARLDAAFEQQKQFTADASHELRTPLAVMISEAQTTLARPRTDAEYRETIETCLATAQQMRKLTEALLELARYDSDLENLPRSAVDLATVAADVVKLVRPLATERQLEISTELSPAPTLGAADRLSQVITNLLSNAIEYSKPGGKIHVTTRAHEKEVFLTVQDHGAGIASEGLPHIFKRFHRADKSRSRANGHSGLGLSICQAIVTAHGGEITVASQLGEGSTFTICLPISNHERHEPHERNR